jgi:hypothetical protein
VCPSYGLLDRGRRVGGGEEKATILLILNLYFGRNESFNLRERKQTADRSYHEANSEPS